MLFANMHFDHAGEHARENSAKLLVVRLVKLAEGAAVIVTGDFNCTEDQPPYKALLRSQGEPRLVLVDAYRAVHPARAKDEATLHGFKGETAGSRIDWILHSAVFEPLTAEIDRSKSEEGRYPSDHFALAATLRWTDRNQ
jgi:endonuclease/exonuclease/phosphatase family metal-dependent hydrolase